MTGERSTPGDAAEQPEASPPVRPAVPVTLAAFPDEPPADSVPRPPPLAAPPVYAPPVVDDLAPARGSVLGDTKVTLVGSGLFRVSIVRIGGLIAHTIGADEPRELRVLAPGADRPGAVDVTIENPLVAPLVLSKAFVYEQLAPPQIASVAPHHVATRGGTELTLTGEGFVKGAVVLFDGKPAATSTVISGTTIDVKAPPDDDGKMVDVSVRNPDGQTATMRRAFMYDRRYG